jgi:hypothetical protein
MTMEEMIRHMQGIWIEVIIDDLEFSLPFHTFKQFIRLP